jgi:outer membrane lipoprotein-sorting protein
MPQNIEKIMAKYYTAMGGLENLKSWKSMKATAKYIMVAQGGTEVSIIVWYKAPDKTRVEISQNGEIAIYVVTNESAWMCDASRGFPEPTPLPEDQAREAINNADVYPFINYKKKGNKIEFLGIEEFEGAEVYKVKLIQNSGAESLHLMDVRTGRELKIINKIWLNGKEMIYETIERDFRKVDGLLLPFLTEHIINGIQVRKMLIEDVEINIEIDDTLFQQETQKKEFIQNRGIHFLLFFWELKSIARFPQKNSAFLSTPLSLTFGHSST